MSKEYYILEITIILARVLIEIVFFAIGASVFSFLNVVIYRLPRHKQFTLGKSMCTSCGHKLAANDLVPIFSWLSLKGKCRYCGEPISIRYTVVELIGGGSAVACTLILGIKIWALVAFIVSGVLVVAAYIIYDSIKENSMNK